MFITLISSSNNLLNKIYSILNLLVVVVNKHAKNESYTIKKRRFKLSRKDVLIKAAIVCDAHDKIVFADYDYRATSSRRKKCSFRCNAKLKNNYENEHNVD